MKRVIRIRLRTGRQAPAQLPLLARVDAAALADAPLDVQDGFETGNLP